MLKKLLPIVLSALLLTACSDPSAPTPSPAPSAKPESGDATLSFSSFDGGGPEYSVKIDDPEIVGYESRRIYNKPDHEEMTGAGYQVFITFTGKKEGETTATVSARSPIAENFDEEYRVSVDGELNVTLTLIEGPERPAGKFKLDYNGHKEWYENAEDFYAPGETVTVYFDLIATDTDYRFYLDEDPVNFGYEEGKGFVISFEMPDHDATLWVNTRNSMEYVPENATVDAMFASDFNCEIPWARTVEMQADEDAVTVVFFTDSPVTDFTILALQLEDVDEDGTAVYKTEERLNAGELTPEEPIAVDLSFYGDMPNNAISYVDQDGATRCLAVEISGMDGSLNLFEI